MLKGAERTLRRSPPDVIQLEIFVIDPALYRETLRFLSERFAYLWAIGVTEQRALVHYPVTRKNIANPQFHRDLQRGETPHYYASSRSCWDWVRLAKAHS